MNETAFADRLVELINSANRDDDYMLVHTARSFAEDTMIERVEQYRSPLTGDQTIEFVTYRGEVFRVVIDCIRPANPQWNGPIRAAELGTS